MPPWQGMLLSEIKANLGPLAAPQRIAGRPRRRAHRASEITALLPYFSTSAYRADGKRIFPSQLEFFRLVADHEAFAVAQRVLHLV